MAIEWKNEPILDSVQLPGSNTKYWVADKEAREMIETVVSATHFLGVTTTPLEDGSTTNPIIINEEETQAVSGDIVIYTSLTGSSLEFIWDGGKWQLLGGQAIEGLGSLAYKNSAEASYIPEGNINLQTSDMTVVKNINVQSVSTSFGIYNDYNAGFQHFSTNLLLPESSYTEIIGISSASVEEIGYVTDVQLEYGNSFVYDILTNYKVGSVIQALEGGKLPSITNTSTITATMGTGTSSTTLIFGFSDIGFDRGNFSQITAKSAFMPSNNSNFIEVVRGGFTVLTSSTFVPSYETFTQSIPSYDNAYIQFYYSANTDIDISTTKENVSVATGATFTGTTTTITVS